jgi:hypothetical protein
MFDKLLTDFKFYVIIHTSSKRFLITDGLMWITTGESEIWITPTVWATFEAFKCCPFFLKPKGWRHIPQLPQLVRREN